MKSKLYRIALLTVSLAAPPLVANAASTTEPVHVIVMTGEGAVSATPDQATVSAGVATQDKMADAAVANNRQAMNRAIGALKQLGIPEHSIRTTGFRLEPQYPRENSRDSQPYEIIGYEVRNSIDVKLDDITRVGAVLDALIAAGANQSTGVNFSIKNPKPLLTQARTIAAKDATDRAETYAHALGTNLGPVISVREGADVAEPRGGVETVYVTGSLLNTPIEVGEQQVTAQVTITWALR